MKLHNRITDESRREARREALKIRAEDDRLRTTTRRAERARKLAERALMWTKKEATR